jgi:chromosome segregation ATPase
MEKELLETLSSLLDKKLEPIKNKLDETYQIVKALEHSAEVSKAEQDKIANDIAHIKGDVEAIKKDVTNVEVITASNWADIAKLKAVK